MNHASVKSDAFQQNAIKGPSPMRRQGNDSCVPDKNVAQKVEKDLFSPIKQVRTKTVRDSWCYIIPLTIFIWLWQIITRASIYCTGPFS